MRSAPRCRCARCSCRSPARSTRRRRPISRSRRWRRHAASAPACIAAIRWSRSPRRTIRRAPADPGDVALDAVNPPALRQLLPTLPLDRATQPLVTSDGIAVLIVCSREQKNLAQQCTARSAGATAERARGTAVTPVGRRSAPPRTIDMRAAAVHDATAARCAT